MNNNMKHPIKTMTNGHKIQINRARFLFANLVDKHPMFGYNAVLEFDPEVAGAKEAIAEINRIAAAVLNGDPMPTGHLQWAEGSQLRAEKPKSDRACFRDGCWYLKIKAKSKGQGDDKVWQKPIMVKNVGRGEEIITDGVARAICGAGMIGNVGVDISYREFKDKGMTSDYFSAKFSKVQPIAAGTPAVIETITEVTEDDITEGKFGDSGYEGTGNVDVPFAKEGTGMGIDEEDPFDDDPVNNATTVH